VPRILVADDNSNIQRMVSLALKDSGMEVVAVGNGEAAVRKLSEMQPDLVLADIFMPVRNGYEVCEFVKQDPRLAQVPVVLLIGAFDPFDEREAQRVHADGILKKPFVPPEPLIRMVSELLEQRKGSAPAAVIAPQPSRTASARPATPEPVHTQAAEAETVDEPAQELSPAKTKLDWSSAQQTVAFSQLLGEPSVSEAPTPETESGDTQDSAVTARRDPNLGEPAFWGTPAPEEEASEENDVEQDESWSSSGQADFPPIETPQEEAPLPASGLEAFDNTPQTEASGDAQPESEILPALSSTFDGNDAAAKPFESPEAAFLDEILPDLMASSRAEAEERAASLDDFAWASPSSSSYGAAGANGAPGTQPVSSIEPETAAVAELVPAANIPGSDFDREESLLNTAPVAASASSLSLAAPAASQVDSVAVEAIAQRVIDRMQPKIIELVTRELLRPVVEALVQRELEKK
jgi:CheY-like chemotaxis protein